MNDVALTSEGMPAVRVGGVRYPLLFSIASVKAWAERKEMSYEDCVARAWDFTVLPMEDLAWLLMIAVRTGEARRLLFAGPPAHEVPEDLADRVFAVAHPVEIWRLVALAWTSPPAPPDPPADPQPDGVTFSASSTATATESPTSAG